MCFITCFARRTRDQELSVSQPAQAFGFHSICVKAALANEFEKPKYRNRHLTFDDDSEGEILIWIEAEAEKSRPVTRTELRHYRKAKYFGSVSKEWVNSFII
jgi:hypothetical protein